MYGALLFTSFLIALFKGKHAYRKLATSHEHLATTHQETTHALLASVKDSAHFVQALQTAGVPTLNSLTDLSKSITTWMASANAPKSVVHDAQTLNEHLIATAVQLDRLGHKVSGYLRLEVATIALHDFLAALQDKLQAQVPDKYIQYNNATQQKTLQCDVVRIKTLLINGVAFLGMTQGEAAPIIIHIEDTQLSYVLASVKQGYTKKIAALRFTMTTAHPLPQLASCYPAQVDATTTQVPKTTQDLPLVTNQRIVSAHYGYGATLVNEGKFTLVYVIPVALSVVRPKDMDAPQMELGNEWIPADTTYPGAQAQEASLLKAVADKTQANLAQVRKAIEILKVYHGPAQRKSGEPFYLHPIAVAQMY